MDQTVKMGVLTVLAKACEDAFRAMTPRFLRGVDRDETEVRSESGQRSREENRLSLPGNQNFQNNTENATMCTNNPEPSNQSFQFIDTSPRYSGPVRYSSPASAERLVQPFDSGFLEDGCQEESSPFGREEIGRTNQCSPQREYLSLEREKPRGENSSGKKCAKVDVFDGESRELDEYLAHFNKVASWNGWSDREKGEQLALSLRGTAHVATLHMKEPNDYEALTKVLAHRFSPKEEIRSRRSEFRNRKRGKGESIGEFGYALRHLVYKAYRGMDPDAQEVFLLEQFIGGLGHNDLQDHVQFRGPETLNEAMSIAREYEAIRGQHRDKWRKPDDTRDYRIPVRRVEEDRESKKKGEQHRNKDGQGNGTRDSDDLREMVKMLHQTVQMLVETKKKESEEQKSPKRACFICGDETHFASRCPKRRDVHDRNRQNGRTPIRLGQAFTPTNGGPLNH